MVTGMLHNLLLKTSWGIKKVFKKAVRRTVYVNDGYAHVMMTERGVLNFVDISTFPNDLKASFVYDLDKCKPVNVKRFYTTVFLRNPELKNSSKVSQVPFYIDDLKVTEDGKRILIPVDSVYYKRKSVRYEKTKFELNDTVGVSWGDYIPSYFESLIDQCKEEPLEFYGDFSLLEFVTYSGNRAKKKSVRFEKIHQISYKFTKKSLFNGLTDDVDTSKFLKSVTRTPSRTIRR